MQKQIQRIFPQDAPKAVGPYSPVIRINQLIFISGQIPINPKTNNIDQKQIEGQTKQVMQNIKSALKSVSCTFSHIVKTTILLSDINHYAKVNQIYGSYFQENKYPTRVTYAVSALPKGSLIEIDATVYSGNSNGQDQLKKKIKTD